MGAGTETQKEITEKFRTNYDSIFGSKKPLYERSKQAPLDEQAIDTQDEKPYTSNT